MNSSELIEKLRLQAHPEGGYYRETYRSESNIDIVDRGQRNVCTAIYFMLENNQISHFHRIKSDEIWYFHLGESMEIVYIENSIAKTVVLGANIDLGECFQFIIPANTWFAARVISEIGFSLVSCSVSPGFDFDDFQLANKRELYMEFPHLLDIIDVFCY